jgi:hypothetical protein
MPKAMLAKQSGRFNKIAALADIAKWYDEKGFVTEKQYAYLKKSIFDKMSDPAYIRKHLNDPLEEAPKSWTEADWKIALKDVKRQILKKKILKAF